jgi:Tfp pilus assembly protein PilF
LQQLHNVKNSFPILMLLGALLLGSGCSLPRIIVLHDPLSADEHVRLGTVYEAQGKTELARAQFREASRLDRKSRTAWAMLGDISFRMKDYDEAENAYEKALSLDPGSGDLHNNLALAYAMQGSHLSKAEVLARKAMELAPPHRPYYLDTLGVVLLKQGKHAEAVVELRKSVAEIPPDQPAMLAEAYLHLSDALAASGDQAGSDEARARYQQLTDGSAPGTPSAPR